VVRLKHAEISAQLDARERATGRRPLLVRPGSLLESRRALRRSLGEHFVYAQRRAREMGFEPAELLVKQQGWRAARHQDHKQARTLIAVELRDSGATLDEIGQVLGGLRPPTVHELLNKARKENDNGNS
jgi:hypothetical protein